MELDPVVLVQQAMANILALDQSSRISGYAVFIDNQLVASGTFTVTDDYIPDRLVKIRNKVIALIEQYNINKVLLEDIQMQTQVNNVATHKILAEVLGVLEELCAERKIPHELIHSSSWKSGLNIKGRDRAAQKRNAQTYVEETYKLKVSQDESDAICIGSHYVKQNKSAWD